MAGRGRSTGYTKRLELGSTVHPTIMQDCLSRVKYRFLARVNRFRVHLFVPDPRACL